MKKTYAPQALAIVFTLGLVGPLAQAQSTSTPRGDVNPFIENLTAAKDTMMATASKLVGTEAGAYHSSPDPATPAVAGPATIKAPNAPQMKLLATNPVKAPSVDTEEAINPLSGKSFSEEQLMRVLNANKLVTEIGRQQVEQAKNLVELNKAAADTRQIESAKQRSDSVNVPVKKPIKPVKVEDSLSLGEQVAVPSLGATAYSFGGVASGSVQIGSENFTAQARTDANPARVVYVDTQPTKAGAGQLAGMGASLVPTPMLSPLPPQMSR